MNEERLLEEELRRALLEYMTDKGIKNKYTEIKNDFYNFKNENILIEKINNTYNVNKELDYYKLNNEISNPRQRFTPIDEEKVADSIISFLGNSSATLNSASARFLRQDEEVAIASIKRDIKSIIYANCNSERFKNVAIEEAIKQNYVIRSDTPTFLTHNIEFLKHSIDLDINSISLVPNDAWTQELANYTYQKLLQIDYVISIATPQLFMSNYNLVKKSIQLKPLSANEIPDRVWVSSFNAEQINELLSIIINSKEDFWLDYSSPDFMKSNTEICLKSIRSNPNSVQHIRFKSNDDREKIINELISSNYVFNNQTPGSLLQDVRLCMCSIKNDINSANYIEPSIINKHPDLKKYLILKDFYSLEQFLKFGINNLQDDDILDYYVSKMGFEKSEVSNEQNLLNDRIKHFVKSTISNPIRVSVARNIFNMVALKEWEEYRRENTDYYTNVFNRICDSLEKNNNFIAAITELKFLLKVDDVLDERKYALFNAFIEYHRIFHDPNIDNKIELLQRKRDDISKNSALFISKSKEDFLSEKMNEFDQLFKQFFVIKTDNPIVKKKVVEVKQREMLKQQFAEHNNELLQKLGIIKEKYLTYEYHESVNKDKINDILDLIIAKIINGDVSKIEDVMNIKPSRFDEYEMYEKVSKIINRLNSNNITFESKDAEKYRHLILFDGKKYTYNGKEFTEADLYQIKGFKDLKYVFGKVKSEIIQIAKSIDNYSNLTQDDIKTVIDNCPFSDEYYDYNFEYTNMWKMRVMNEFMNGFEESKNILLDDRNYNALCKLFTDGGLAQLALLNDLYSSNCIENQPADSYKIFNRIAKCGLSRISLTEILHNIDSIRSFVGEQNFSIENFGQIIDFKEIFKYADLMDISILGTDTLKKIYSNNGFTSKSQETRIRVACDLVSTMPKKNKSTIPYVNGNVGNYNYSMYDSTDASLLTSGLDTQACFRVCGNDNDFLHYCALDKNGFVIKLTDSDGNFIGRASGFRNGNGVYINQLRTIYDKSSSAYQSEKRSLIDVFDKACKDIVKSSQYNSDEEQKIDFVVVTKSYSLSDVESNVSNEVYNTIGDSPMETKSQDWKDFISTTANLDESLTSNGFTTDFGNYSLICMASAVGKLTPDKIKKGDVPAVYSRPRKKIEIKKSDDKEIERIINKVRAINSHQRKEKFEYLKIPVGSRAIYGDNWYVLFNELGIIDKCCLNEDEIAMQEYEVCYNNFTNSNYISKIIQTAEPTGLRK